MTNLSKATWRQRVFRVTLAAAGVCGVLATNTAAQDTSPIETTSGPVVGLPADEHGVLAFLGIPYAESTGGQWRFLPPRSAQKSQHVIKAVAFGSTSAQVSYREPQLSEDSLNLNVWTPGLSGNRPVMVWIHGGGNWVGSNRTTGAAGLAAQGNVVIVSINYRLGIFGFLDVSPLGGEKYKESANNGLLDQIEALRWVKQNIVKFGGNPNDVTVFGLSAGGADISALLAMKSPEQYFHRAIAQSGTGASSKSKELAQRVSRMIFERGGIKTMDDLLAKKPQDLIAIQSEALKHLSEHERDSSFQPTVDGTLIKEFPLDALAHGNARHIDLVVGTSLNELRGYIGYDPGWKTISLAELDQHLRVKLPESTLREFQAVYRRSRPGLADWQVTLDIASDLTFRAGAIRMAELQSRYNKNVYMYLFERPSANAELGAPHGSESPFLWGNLKGRNLGNLDDPTVRAEIHSLSTAIQEYWTSFARTGIPTATGQPAWPRYDVQTRQTLVFNKTVAVATDPLAAERTLLAPLDLNRREQ
jgi:para-nitrobenzyl esterase